MYFLSQLPDQLPELNPTITHPGRGGVEPDKEGKGFYPTGDARLSHCFLAEAIEVDIEDA